MNTVSAILLWVESLLSLLLIMAAVFAGTARWPRKLYRVTVRTLVILSALVPVLGFLGLSVALRSFEIVHTGLAFSLPLAVGLVIGIVVLCRLSRLRLQGWPVLRLWIAAVVACSVTSMTLWNLDVSSRLQMQIARSDAAALAVSVAPPIVPDEQNAAVAYNVISKLLKGDEKTLEIVEALDKLGTAEDSPWDIARAATYVDQLQGVIDRIEKGASRPCCRFEHAYSRPSISMLLPELTPLRDNAHLLAYAARVAAYRGQPERALQLASAMYRIQEHAGTSPCLVSGLVAVGVGALADDTVVRTLPAVTDAKQLSLLSLPLDDQPSRIIDRAMISEESRGVTVMLELAEAPSMAPLYTVVTGGDAWALNELPLTPAATLSRFISWQDEVDAYRKSIQTARGLSAVPVFQWKETEEEVNARILTYKRQGILTSILLPSLIKVPQITSRVTASHRMTEMALAATRYRLEHGHYPTSADQMVPAYLPAIPIDPFDGKPLRMKTDAEGLLFYSVGVDRIDNGGVELKTGSKQTGWDIVMHLKTPETAKRNP